MAARRNLSATCVHWSLQATSPAHLPPWKGSLLRGALGWALGRTAHGAPAPVWPGLTAGITLAAVIFDPQTAWQDQMATAPVSLQCLDDRTSLQTGDALTGRMLLFGDWPDWTVALLEGALSDAATHGLGAARHPFRLSAWHTEPVPWPVPPPSPTSVELSTLTPCRLNDRKEACTTLHPPAIARNLLRRWRQLHRQLLGRESDGDHQTLAVAADQLHALPASLGTQAATISRWSNRQGRHVDMEGIFGSVTIAGDSLPLLAPFLARAPLLHVGKQPVFGLGQVTVHWLSDQVP